MGRFNMWMGKSVRGRYGMDQMNRTLSIVALILIAANLFLRMRIIKLACGCFADIYLLSCISRNINRRAAENQRYRSLQDLFVLNLAGEPGTVWTDSSDEG